MKRWLLLPVGIAIAAGALYSLATPPGETPPLGHIDAESRAKLERVLSEADPSPTGSR